jgi:amino acid transporter
MVPIASFALMLVVVATISVVFTQNVRLPMTAGWDYLLPQWFTELHSNRKTPINSIIFTGAVALVLGGFGLIGVGYQVAFQLLLNASFVLWALTYLVMFAIPLIGLKGISPRPSLWLKLASVSGFLITLLYVSLSVLPIVDESYWLAFAGKIIAVVMIVNIVGIFMFISAEKKRSGLTPTIAKATERMF